MEFGKLGLRFAIMCFGVANNCLLPHLLLPGINAPDWHALNLSVPCQLASATFYCDTAQCWTLSLQEESGLGAAFSYGGVGLAQHSRGQSSCAPTFPSQLCADQLFTLGTAKRHSQRSQPSASCHLSTPASDQRGNLGCMQ